MPVILKLIKKKNYIVWDRLTAKKRHPDRKNFIDGCAYKTEPKYFIKFYGKACRTWRFCVQCVIVSKNIRANGIREQ